MNPMIYLSTAAARTDELARRADEHHANLEQIDQRNYFTEEHRQHKRREAQSAFAAYTSETVRAARTALDEAETKAVKVLSAPGDEQVETAKARASGRVARLLDSKGPAAALQVLSEQEDAAGLRQLRAELPAFIAAQDLLPTERRATTQDLLLAVDRALRPFTSGVEADAIDVRDRVDTERARLDATLEHASNRTPTSRLKYAFATAGRA